MTKQRRVRVYKKADYLTAKAIEAQLGTAWDKRQNAYRAGCSDSTVASSVAETVGHPVNPASVAHLRKMLGFLGNPVRAFAAVTKASGFSQGDLRNLAETLQKERRVVCLLNRNKRFMVYNFEKYVRGQARMAKAIREYRPWEKLRKNGAGKADDVIHVEHVSTA